MLSYLNASTSSGANEIMNRWEEKNGVTFTAKEDMDIDSFKESVEGVDQWFVEELKKQGYDDGQELDYCKTDQKHLLEYVGYSHSGRCFL